MKLEDVYKQIMDQMRLKMTEEEIKEAEKRDEERRRLLNTPTSIPWLKKENQ